MDPARDYADKCRRECGAATRAMHVFNSHTIEEAFAAGMEYAIAQLAQDEADTQAMRAAANDPFMTFQDFLNLQADPP